MKEIELFVNPSSIAVIGSTDRAGAAGRLILENLLPKKNEVKIYPVNSKHETLFDLTCYPSIGSVPEIPDLVVIITPAETVAGIVDECGKVGSKAIVIISSGFQEIGGEGIIRQNKLVELASQYKLKIMGPNCMGIIRPSTHLNTTFYRKMPRPGNVAFISQSGALGTGILDWAITKNIGFSLFASLGSMVGVDFADVIDYLSQDPQTRSVIIYPESIGNARKFMSAARSISRVKTVITLKPGKSQEGAAVAKTHTGAMFGEDLFYDAVFRRAGLVRVEEMKDLFYCASMMNTTRLPKGNKLAIITNGGGPAAIATDHLISRNGSLARLSEGTIASIKSLITQTWNKSNPVDILEDADYPRFASTIEITERDPGVDGLLVIFTPQGTTEPAALANAIVKVAKAGNKPILTAFISGQDIMEARGILDRNGVPDFEFPEDAIRSYLYMYNHERNLEILYETPEESPIMGATKNHIKALVQRSIRKGKTYLNAEDTTRLLSTYGIPFPAQEMVTSQEEAVAMVKKAIEYIKANAKGADIIHKSDVGGIALNLNSGSEVKKAYNHIIGSIKEYKSNCHIEGMTVQKMIARPDYELIIGCKKDPVCGPIIMFGSGGIEAEFFKDIAGGLPPLNLVLARRVIEQTKIYQILNRGFRTRQPVDLRLLDEILVKVSNLIVDFPEIKEMDINPLAVSRGVVTALDTRIILEDEAPGSNGYEYRHLIITPYPTHLIRPWICKDGKRVLLRPAKPDDEPMEKEFFENLTESAMRNRFMGMMSEMSHNMLSCFCNIDYDREMTIIAEYQEGNERRIVGTATMSIPADSDLAEFSVVVAEDFEGTGLALKLCDVVVGIAQEKQLKGLHSFVLSENTKMLGLAKRLGFTFETISPEDIRIVLEL